MIPIYEQGDRKGIGHSLESFLPRFEQICRERRGSNQAQSFAFIFYDFDDNDIRKILKDEGVFAKLDRLSHEKLIIFYLHASSQRGVQRFNKAFASKLGVADHVELPCVVFFKLGDAGFTDVAVAIIDSTDLIHGFHELYGIIERRLADDNDDKHEDDDGLQFVRWIKSATRFVSLEVVRDAISNAVGGHLPS